tara:strand:+ start:365 stop:1168 length:804 start_codon:yes stop_codon:yes gene_type:complete
VTVLNVFAGDEGEYIKVECEPNCTVAELKKNIHQSTNIKPYCQQILGKCESHTLNYDYTLTEQDSSGLLLITIKPSELWAPSNVFNIDNETATWNEPLDNFDISHAYNNYIWMKYNLPTHSKHQMSFRLKHHLAYGGHMCGLISSETEGDSDTFDKENGWFLQTFKESENGKGNACLVGHTTDQIGDETVELEYCNTSEKQLRWGELNDCNIVTMEADLDARTLKFWFNGRRVGRYFKDVQPRVRWAASVYWGGSAVQVVETPSDLE